MNITTTGVDKLFMLLILLSYGCSSNSQILEGLKDAILNAEGTFGDIFRTLDSVTKNIKLSKDTWKETVEEDCIYLCPDGSTPKKNKHHKPSSNGCGIPGMEIDSQFLPLNDMTRCCDQHDFCYSTCNKDKDECDLSFKKCLYKLCDNSKLKMTESFLTGCKTAAKVLYSGTTMFGCKSYKSAQEEACYCPPSRRFSGDEL